MSSAIPKQPYLKSGTYDFEPSTFGDLNNVNRFFATKKMRAALTSPPEARAVGELEAVYDKTLNRIYMKIDGVLRYVQFT